jgi:hypothetical protein
VIRKSLVALVALALGGCLLRPHPPMPPIDCAEERAAQRFPDVCDGGPVEEEDAGPPEEEDAGAPEDAGASEDAGAEPDAP